MLLSIKIWKKCAGLLVSMLWYGQFGLGEMRLFFKRKTLNLGEVIDLAKTRMAFWVKGKYKVSGYSIEDFKRSLDDIRRLMIQKLKD